MKVKEIMLVRQFNNWHDVICFTDDENNVLYKQYNTDFRFIFNILFKLTDSKYKILRTFAVSLLQGLSDDL